IEGQRDSKNTALIPSVRTLADSKLGVVSIGYRPSWNSIGVPPSVSAERIKKNIDLLMIKRRENTSYL
ncbi:hypothetical protein BHE74_00036379, partial [Ensete ventricosum]